MEKFYKRFTCKKWRKFFIGDFHVKLKVSFEFFIRDFPGKKIKWKKFLKGFLWKIEAGGKILKGFPFKFTTWLVLHVLHFIGNFFYNPRASLARAAFKRDFLDNHGGRRSIAGIAQHSIPISVIKEIPFKIQHVQD